MLTESISKATYHDCHTYLPSKWLSRILTVDFNKPVTEYRLDVDVVLTSYFQDNIIDDLSLKYDIRKINKQRFNYVIILVMLGILTYYNVSEILLFYILALSLVLLVEHSIIVSKQYMLEKNKYANALVKELVNISSLRCYNEAYKEQQTMKNIVTRNLNEVTVAYKTLLELVAISNSELAAKHIEEFDTGFESVNIYTQYTSTKH